MLTDNARARSAGTDLRRVGIHPDYWYPLAWSHELKRGKALARNFSGEPIVLFRDASGAAIALEDRCAHRQVPLHMGRVEGNTLRCGYHGWAYDRAGQCVDVPYLGRERVCNAVRSYPVAEVDGMILVFPGDPALSEASRPSTIGRQADRNYVTRQLYRDVACHYSFMHENLFDMNHQFLHRKQMGLMRARCLGRRSGENWCEVDYTFMRAAGRGSWGEAAIHSIGKREGDEGEIDRMTIRTEYPYQRLKFWSGGEEPALDVWLAYVPTDSAQRTNRTFGYLSVKKPGPVFLLYAAWPLITWFTERIFAEDQEIVEREQAAYEAQGADWNNEVFPPILDLRDVLARCGAA